MYLYQQLCSHSLSAGPQMSTSPICTGFCYLKSDPAHSLCLTQQQTQCETPDEYFTVSRQ